MPLIASCVVVPHRMIPECLCLFRTISHYVTNQPNSQNAGALGLPDGEGDDLDVRFAWWPGERHDSSWH